MRLLAKGTLNHSRVGFKTLAALDPGAHLVCIELDKIGGYEPRGVACADRQRSNSCHARLCRVIGGIYGEAKGGISPELLDFSVNINVVGESITERLCVASHRCLVLRKVARHLLGKLEIGEEILQSLEDNEIKWIVIPTNPESTEGQIWSAIMENYTIYTQTKEYTLLVANP